MTIKCPLSKSDCSMLVGATFFLGYCCGEYKDCFHYGKLRNDETHSAKSWVDKIDKWRNKFK